MKTTNKNTKKTDEASVLLEQGVRNVFNNENYVNYLNFQSKFHKYSVNNQMLIFMQKPDATRVAGFTTWDKQLHRKVKKGEKAIKILAPIKHELTIDKDKDGNEIPEEERKTKTWITYKAVNVFDVSQTDGEPIPEPVEVCETLEGNFDGYDMMLERLTNAAVSNKHVKSIVFKDISGGATGYFHRGHNEIAIQRGMSERETLSVLIHEIAHSILHKVGGKEVNADRRTKEVQAESIAYIVSHNIGLDTSKSSFGYIAEWAGNKEVKQLVQSMNIIKKTADEILDMIAA